MYVLTIATPASIILTYTASDIRLYGYILDQVLGNHMNGRSCYVLYDNGSWFLCRCRDVVGDDLNEQVLPSSVALAASGVNLIL